MTAAKTEKIEEELLGVTTKLVQQYKAGRRIYFLDEVTFSSHTRLQKAWSTRGSVFELEKRSLHFPVVACVGTIDTEGKLIHLGSYDFSVNVERFIKYLEGLGRKVKLRGSVLFLDNLKVHHNAEVKEWCRRRGLELLFNAPYSCTYNPIEWLWAYSKKHFYQEEAIITKKCTCR